MVVSMVMVTTINMAMVMEWKKSMAKSNIN